jgi:hypothetical protein
MKRKRENALLAAKPLQLKPHVPKIQWSGSVQIKIQGTLHHQSEQKTK